MRLILAALLALLAAPIAAELAITGPIVVIDGDTFDVGSTRVRLFGIDAPEAGQTCIGLGRGGFDCGAWVTAAVRAQFDGAEAQCALRDIDRYGRAVATCRVVGADVGRHLVRQGLARAYRRYAMDYDLDERAAAGAGRGLWAFAMQEPAVHRAGTALPDPGASATGCAIKGNISANGRIYHAPGQADYDRTAISPAKGERWFCSAAEAEAMGWRAARR